MQCTMHVKGVVPSRALQQSPGIANPLSREASQAMLPPFLVLFRAMQSRIASPVPLCAKKP